MRAVFYGSAATAGIVWHLLCQGCHSSAYGTQASPPPILYGLAARIMVDFAVTVSGENEPRSSFCQPTIPIMAALSVL